MKYTYELSRAMKALLEGDMTAFRSFYLLTLYEVNFHAALVTQSQNEANKLIVRIYRKMYLRLNRLEKAEDTVMWFNQTLYNELTEWVNLNCSPLLMEEEDGRFKHLPAVPVIADIDTDTMQTEAETANLLASLIPQLLPIHALTGLAYFYDGLDVEEMKDLLQVDENRVKERIKYAMRTLESSAVEYGKENREAVRTIDAPLILLAYVLLFQTVRVPNSEDLYEEIIESCV